MMTRSAPNHSNSNLHRPRVNCFDLPVSISSLVANVSCQGLNAISSSASMSGLAPWIALALGKCPGPTWSDPETRDRQPARGVGNSPIAHGIDPAPSICRHALDHVAGPGTTAASETRAPSPPRPPPLLLHS